MRFSAMIAVATVVMFGLMYLNSYAVDHVFYRQTRAWMALVMGAVMSLLMLGFMWKMYKDAGRKLTVIAAALVVFTGSLWLVRSQQTVDDVFYMKAMIHHHSIAILAGKRAHIRDPCVRALADGIIKAKVSEIAQMKALIADLELHPVPDDANDLPPVQ